MQRLGHTACLARQMQHQPHWFAFVVCALQNTGGICGAWARLALANLPISNRPRRWSSLMWEPPRARLIPANTLVWQRSFLGRVGGHFPPATKSSWRRHDDSIGNDIRRRGMRRRIGRVCSETGTAASVRAMVSIISPSNNLATADACRTYLTGGWRWRRGGIGCDPSARVGAAAWLPTEAA
jgi:hypothetical protein